MTVEELIDNFSFLDGWEEKYQYVIDLGHKLEPLDEKFKTDDWKVKGCQSQVWLVPQIQNGVFHFKGDSDAILVKGIISIVLLIYNDKTADEIKNIDVTKIFVKLGLEENLTLSRRNGMLSMVEKIKQYAAAA
ncbi:MAG: SufE family protein [Alphaproteobacteria bacterium]|nr:SufE family protein [Alphaproteobacteria bacterium]MDY4689653.1 SufE family protein [Alphaproteobacteria bacterium]